MCGEINTPDISTYNNNAIFIISKVLTKLKKPFYSFTLKQHLKD